MSVELCECPVLRFAAETERLVGMGLEVGGYDAVKHHIIAAVRQRYGCRGPGWNGWCPWNVVVGMSVAPSYRVPEVHPHDGDGKTGQYL
jgi:hypothetical protein